MENLFYSFANYAALALETVTVIVIIIGGAEAVSRAVWTCLRHFSSESVQRDAWRSFARWLILALEFTLAADIIRTAISPSWDDIGQLAAIAGIRTFLNYFLERDLKELKTEAG